MTALESLHYCLLYCQTGKWPSTCLAAKAGEGQAGEIAGASGAGRPFPPRGRARGPPASLPLPEKPSSLKLFVGVKVAEMQTKGKIQVAKFPRKKREHKKTQHTHTHTHRWQETKTNQPGQLKRGQVTTLVWNAHWKECLSSPSPHYVVHSPPPRLLTPHCRWALTGKLRGLVDGIWKEDSEDFSIQHKLDTMDNTDGHKGLSSSSGTETSSKVETLLDS